MTPVSGDSLVSAACVVVVGVIGWAVRASIGRITDSVNVVDRRVSDLSLRLDSEVDEVCGDLQDHKVRCHADSNAVIASKVRTSEKEIESLRKFAHWTANCLQVLFQKTPGAHIPPRND